jgi:hypothetical protein
VYTLMYLPILWWSIDGASSEARPLRSQPNLAVFGAL